MARLQKLSPMLNQPACPPAPRDAGGAGVMSLEFLREQVQNMIDLLNLEPAWEIGADAISRKIA